MIHIKSDQKLLGKGRDLSDKMRVLADIVQNDMDMTDTELLEVKANVQVVKERLAEWWKEIAEHIRNCN